VNSVATRAASKERFTLTSPLTVAPDSGPSNVHSEGAKGQKQPLLPDVGLVAIVPDAWQDLWQPRHHVVSRLAQYFQVVWMEPNADTWGSVENGRPADRFDCSESGPDFPGPGFMVYRPEFWLTRSHRLSWLDNLIMQQRYRIAQRLLRRRGCKRIILYIWRPTLLPNFGSVAHDLSCYHIDDEYSFSPIELPLSDVEKRLIREVDQVFLHSLGLLEKKGNLNPNTMFVPNGVDYQAYSRQLPEPLDLASIPRPRIGYTGFIKRHLDWQVLLHLSQERPDWSFVFVGPQSPHDDIVTILRRLANRPNVHFLGPKPTHLLCAYPQHFDVCIMPYQVNDYTKYVYPLKLHEYLASGRPTVGTRIRTLCEFDGVVSLANAPEEWSAAIEHSLSSAANSPERRAVRQEVARQYDWERLVVKIAGSMAEGLGPEYASRLSDLLLANGKRKPDLTTYRSSPREQARIADLLASIPKGYSSVLDIGARDGYISNLLAADFDAVTALDLEEPQVSNQKVVGVKGDVTQLEYPDNAFDVVVCTEVLEHIPPHLLDRACSETSRVAKYAVVVGVPYKQDRRLGRTNCVFCGKENPCWGHVNDFDEGRLKRLFQGLVPIKTSFIGSTRERTNFVSAYLMRKARNPWGTYEQDEACVHCGNTLIKPGDRTVAEAVCARLGLFLNRVQSSFFPQRPAWIHMVFQKGKPVARSRTAVSVES
jgi:2-polyprenyl-3-methyl-5-hydroxy-6-metoxy-1,4-benzoquinol methylase